MSRLTIWLAGMAACLGAVTAPGATRGRTTMLPKHRVGLLVYDKWSYPPADGSEKPSTTTGDKPAEPPPEKPLVTAVWYPASRTRKRPFHHEVRAYPLHLRLRLQPQPVTQGEHSKAFHIVGNDEVSAL